jgi:hypothetical protein
MKTKILFAVLVTAFLAACDKDTYQTKPQLTLRKVNTNVLSRGQDLVFTIEVTDAEGDIQDSMFIQEIVKNCANSGFTNARYRMPQFTGTKNLKADIEVTYNYNLVPPKCPQRNDTATFRFWIKDNAKNMSDTLVSPTIVILQ